MVYRWGFPCLDYSFDVLISWSRKLSLYRWFCRIYSHRVLLQIYGYIIIIIIVYMLISWLNHLGSTPLVPCSYHIIPCVFPTWYHLLSSLCLLLYAVLTTRFLMHVYDSNLSIHVCLFLHATWHSQHHSLGSSTPLIFMSRFRSLKFVDSSGCWSE